MITETLSALTASTKSVSEPAQKLNQEAVAAVQKLAAHQIESLRAYADLGLSQLKTATEVNDIAGLQDLMSKQTDVLRTFGGRLVSDLGALFELSADYTVRATKIGVEAVPALSLTAKPKAQ